MQRRVSMKKKEITYTSINSEISPSELVKAAEKAMEYAYVPYSGYKVGAALLTKSGKLYTGCNIENASFSPTNCAERTAVFKAVSEGEREFSAIAVVGGKDGVIDGIFPPCGVCRQVLREFCDPDTFIVYLGKKNGEYETYSLEAMLPVSFSNSKMHK